MKNKARAFRDPVHDLIDTRLDAVAGPVISALVDAPLVQRLRRVRQLGLAHLVFHGAEHSRFAHSLGVVHVATRMCDRLGVDDPERRLPVLCAALLHDVGHAPFSHVLERVAGVDHERVSSALIRDPSTDINAVLRGVDTRLPDRVARIVEGEAPDFTAHIVASQLDADRADYLLRDALMTGVGVGRYDLERILMCLEHDDEGLLVGAGALESVEGYLVARFHMYRLLYFHRVARAAEAMLELVFARARQLLEAGALEPLPHPAVAAALRRQAPDAVLWLRFTDATVWATLDLWRDAADPVLAGLAAGLLDRRLFASLERDVDLRGGGAAEDDELVERVRDGLTANERWLFFVDDASDVPYRPYTPGSTSRTAIRVRERDGRVGYIEQRSHLARALADARYRLRRWYFHPSIAAKVRRLADVG
ncbi:MAG: HD domain-containing protein [Myxococcales bacterium]|nr:HD domain-containing protein [Myxococcales bacterium]MCB9520156.1 HD domain-containing protein [Myxococcales bacterium]MCB9531222.1 HD domain-containing protein [Myxococcales bacterium]MCB9534299.1 HD domain-containing protein [Myxococcales bacterium]